MGFVLDIIIICVAALFVLVGVRRGFIRAAVRFVGVFAAAVLASILGDIFATLIYDNFFREEFTRKISESISGVAGPSGVSRVLEGLPDFLRRALEGAGVTADKLTALLATSSGDAAQMISDTISPVFINMLKVLCVIVLFMVLMLVVRGLAHIISGVFNFPLLGWVNSLLGGVFGLLMALLTIWIILAVINVFTPMFTAETQRIIEDTVSTSVIADKFVGFNPFDGMFK